MNDFFWLWHATRFSPPDGKFSFVTAIAILACGCQAPSPAVAPSATLVAHRPAGKATLHVIWPCLNSPLFGNGRGIAAQHAILVDGRQVGTVSPCSHSTVTINSGNYGIRLSDPSFDIGGLFSYKGEMFTVPLDDHLYLRVQNTNPELIEIDASRAKAEAQAIDANR